MPVITGVHTVGVPVTDQDAALAFYLSKADPLMVLRDLLGHSTVLTTEKYLRKLDTTRIYRESYERAGTASGLGVSSRTRKSHAAMATMPRPRSPRISDAAAAQSTSVRRSWA